MAIWSTMTSKFAIATSKMSLRILLISVHIPSGVEWYNVLVAGTVEREGRTSDGITVTGVYRLVCSVCMRACVRVCLSVCLSGMCMHACVCTCVHTLCVW